MTRNIPINEMFYALMVTALIRGLKEDKEIWEKRVECRTKMALPAYPDVRLFLEL